MIEDELLPIPGNDEPRVATYADLWALWWDTHRAILELVAEENPKAVHLELARRWLKQNGVERVPGTPKVTRERLEGLEFPLEF